MYINYPYGTAPVQYYIDPLYLMFFLVLILSVSAQIMVSSRFKKYSQQYSARGITSDMSTMAILNAKGIYDVPIQQVQGNLTDHYDPRNKVLRLSTSVYGSSSIAALAVAAHEAGHAIQHHENYLPLRIRNFIAPIASFASKMALPIFLIGMILGYTKIASAGVIIFGLVFLFYLITLPVEFNASRRAIRILESEGILSYDEIPGARKVLSAAALTYVASMLAALLQFLRFLSIANRKRN